jgi:hypothetical protein
MITHLQQKKLTTIFTEEIKKLGYQKISFVKPSKNLLLYQQLVSVLFLLNP